MGCETRVINNTHVCVILRFCDFVQKKLQARSSAKSRSSSWENKVHWMPPGLSAVVFLITQSMAIRKRMGDMVHPCHTPDYMVNQSDGIPSTMTLHSKRRKNSPISVTIFGGIPYALTIFHRVPRWRLSKAFRKSMKLMCNGAFHSTHCSMMFFRAKIWSVQPLSLLKPACSCLRFWSTTTQFCQVESYKRLLMVSTTMWSPSSCHSFGGCLSWAVWQWGPCPSHQVLFPCPRCFWRVLWAPQ